MEVSLRVLRCESNALVFFLDYSKIT